MRRLIELVVLPLQMPVTCGALGIAHVPSRRRGRAVAAGGSAGVRSAAAAKGAVGATGVLLCGPSGVGKSTLVQSLVTRIAGSSGPRGTSGCVAARLFQLKGADVVGGEARVGSAEQALRSLFGSARAFLRSAAREARAYSLTASAAAGHNSSAGTATTAAAAVVLLDDLDVLCPRRVQGAEAAFSGTGAASHRVVAQLLTILDGVEDSAPGDYERQQRQRGTEEAQVGERAEEGTEARQHGVEVCFATKLFVAAFRHVGPSLLRDYSASLVRLRSLGNGGEEDGGDESNGGEGHRGGRGNGDGEDGGRRRSGFGAVGGSAWCGIGGQDEAKRRLQQAVTWPLKRGPAEGMRRLNVAPPRGVLLYGPPGTGKTLLARSAARASHASFLAFGSADIFDAHVGEAEARVRRAFAAARSAMPAVLFFDEIEALVGSRDGGDSGGVGVQQRVLATFLTEMDGLGVGESAACSLEGKAGAATKRLLVIGATNRPDLIDAALMRPGRFDQIVYVPPPDRPARVAAFDIHSRVLPLADGLKQRAAATAGGVGEVLCALCDAVHSNAQARAPDGGGVADARNARGSNTDTNAGGGGGTNPTITAGASAKQSKSLGFYEKLRLQEMLQR
eukprot:g5196.t1